MKDNGAQRLSTIKGLLATAFGIMFMIFAYSIMLRMVMFICGTLLVYYGLQLLNIPALNNVVSSIKAHTSKFLS